MNFEWLQMRITEEGERRAREQNTRERLPKAFDELKEALVSCMEIYQAAFGNEAAGMFVDAQKVRLVVREQEAGRWQSRATLEVSLVPTLPGFQIERAGQPASVIEVGILAGDKYFYRDRERDEYLSLEDVTRRVLDKLLFPQLSE